MKNGRLLTLSILSSTALSACASDYDPYGRYGAEIPVTRAASVQTYDRYSRYDDVSPYEVANVRDDYRGIAGARYAHTVFDDVTAERFDGDCEPVVTVAYGDTVSDIAEYCDTTVAAIMAANPSLSNPHALRVGQTLRIPNIRGSVYEGQRFSPAPARVASVTPRVETYASPAVAPTTDRLIDTPPITTATNVVTRATPPASAPVVIYINSNPAPASAQGTAVITVDTNAPHTIRQDDYRAPTVTTGGSYRLVSGTGQLEQPLGTVPAGSTVHYRTSLPKDAAYEDLGTACMEERPDGARIFSVSTSLAGPACGNARPVRLYKSASIPK
ncbi:LysM peptidoglycan-binding domain-containing protein [Parvularcula lutaonensis]|uniref:LysM peptidoglycan-binding domain-containing protein n=1 Tax=Parvularcula lutaonensis TaxID=491923 RepID=A0ABV7MBR3_9PROT|nr:LysM peptidoglycan-binding domain-containing protein [Parvularcula lutaonensis]GGY49042.1 hypothetical protein GCM10007148_16930 [Parvularcula lutaonensis]